MNFSKSDTMDELLKALDDIRSNLKGIKGKPLFSREELDELSSELDKLEDFISGIKSKLN